MGSTTYMQETSAPVNYMQAGPVFFTDFNQIKEALRLSVNGDYIENVVHLIKRIEESERQGFFIAKSEATPCDPDVHQMD